MSSSAQPRHLLEPDDGDGGPATIGGLVLECASTYGTTQAVSDGDTTLSFADLASSAVEVAKALLGSGVMPGDRVAIWSPNSHHWIRMALGVYCTGAIVVPINTRYRGPEMWDLLGRTAARVLLIHNGFLGYDYRAVALDAPDLGGALRLVVDLGSGEHDVAGVTTKAHVTDWQGFLANGSQVPEQAVQARIDAVEPDDVSDIVFTSGTTGRAKGVTITHRASIRLYTDFGHIWGLRPGDRHLLSLPMFHAGGLKAGILTCLIHGVTAVPMAVFDTDVMMATIERERITVLNGPPTVHYALLDHDARLNYDLSSLRLGATGAAVVPVEMVRRIASELSYEHFITAYGMTECAGTATMCRRDDTADVIANSNGKAMPGISVCVVDGDGTVQPAGQAGEVLIRGYNVTPGYWDSPEQTEEALRDGWLHTGDVGTLDDQGNLNITDRIKDMFMVGGFNVSPTEVEHVLIGHPAVGDVAVVGVPDARLGEVAQAYVIQDDGHDLTESELIAWARERMANFKVPRSVLFIDALPRTPSGKVIKSLLRVGAHDATA